MAYNRFVMIACVVCLGVTCLTNLTPLQAFLDHVFDFHLDHEVLPDYGKYQNDPNWEDHVLMDRLEKDFNSGGRSDSEGRDFTPDRDK